MMSLNNYDEPAPILKATGREFVSAVQYDPRYPNQNQTRRCQMSYVDFHKCQKLRGEDYEPCFYFKRVYEAMCPNAWVEKWEEWRENDIFPVKI